MVRKSSESDRLCKVIIIAVISAVVVSFLTVSITGNVIKVKGENRGTEIYARSEVYSRSEIDSMMKSKMANKDVITFLNQKCQGLQWDTSDAKSNLRKDSATGNQLCATFEGLIGSGKPVCAMAGRVYGGIEFNKQTGIDVHSCGDNIVDLNHAGWALCCTF
jgi:hypothetical protein